VRPHQLGHPLAGLLAVLLGEDRVQLVARDLDGEVQRPPRAGLDDRAGPAAREETPDLLDGPLRGGKADPDAAAAAERVEAIIATMASHDGIRPAQVNKLTRHGEARIDKCKKFDLVGGYRLVYVREEDHYFFLFAGTHDDESTELFINEMP